METKKIKCFNCEVDYEIITDENLEPVYCPFCGEEIITTDFNEELDKEFEESLFEELDI